MDAATRDASACWAARLSPRDANVTASSCATLRSAYTRDAIGGSVRCSLTSRRAISFHAMTEPFTSAETDVSETAGGAGAVGTWSEQAVTPTIVATAAKPTAREREETEEGLLIRIAARLRYR